jgi:signal peptidase I
VSSGPSTERGTEPPDPSQPPDPGQPSDPDSGQSDDPSPTRLNADQVPSVAVEERPAPSPADATFGARTRRSGRTRGLSFLQELPILLLVAFLLALVIKTFLIQAFYIPSASMDPTLKVGDRVLVNKLVYHFHPPRRGDIIVFQDPHPGTQPHRNPVQGFFHWIGEGLGVQTSPDKDFIKRVIGLPGDKVRMDENGGVFVNGVALKEPYLNANTDTRPYPSTDAGPEAATVTVPKDMLFVMGDNRADSNDSRYGLGFIPMDRVVGRAFVIIWPPSRFRWMSGIHYPGF